MALVEPAAADKDSVGSFSESPENEFRVNSAGAHHPYHPHIGGVLIPGNSGQVGSGVATPVT
jgi:hypothetical protein